jgi:hypothetical protein
MPRRARERKRIALIGGDHLEATAHELGQAAVRLTRGTHASAPFAGTGLRRFVFFLFFLLSIFQIHLKLPFRI